MRINEDYLDNIEIDDNAEDEVTAEVDIEEQYEHRLFMMLWTKSVDEVQPRIQCLKFLYRTLSASQVIDSDGFGINLTYVKDASHYSQHVSREDFTFNSVTLDFRELSDFIYTNNYAHRASIAVWDIMFNVRKDMMFSSYVRFITNVVKSIIGIYTNQLPNMKGFKYGALEILRVGTKDSVYDLSEDVRYANYDMTSVINPSQRLAEMYKAVNRFGVMLDVTNIDIERICHDWDISDPLFIQLLKIQFQTDIKYKKLSFIVKGFKDVNGAHVTEISVGYNPDKFLFDPNWKWSMATQERFKKGMTPYIRHSEIVALCNEVHDSIRQYEIKVPNEGFVNVVYDEFEFDGDSPSIRYESPSYLCIDSYDIRIAQLKYIAEYKCRRHGLAATTICINRVGEIEPNEKYKLTIPKTGGGNFVMTSNCTVFNFGDRDTQNSEFVVDIIGHRGSTDYIIKRKQSVRNEPVK